MALIRSSRENVRLTITRSFNKFVGKKFAGAALRTAAREVALAEIDMIRKRTQRGLDMNGRPFRPLSASYQRWKREFIANGYKTKKGRGRGTPTAFAATQANQFMRLTGRTFADMYVRDIAVKAIKTGWRVTYAIDFRTARSKKIASFHNLLGTGRARVLRPFMGPAKGREAQDRLLAVFRKVLK